MPQCPSESGSGGIRLEKKFLNALLDRLALYGRILLASQDYQWDCRGVGLELSPHAGAHPVGQVKVKDSRCVPAGAGHLDSRLKRRHAIDEELPRGEMRQTLRDKRGVGIVIFDQEGTDRRQIGDHPSSSHADAAALGNEPCR
jgi:hypothetical protein